MKRLSVLLALIFIACTGWAAVDFPVTIPFTNSAVFTNSGPRSILARVTISVVTPQAASATVSIASATGTNLILSHSSTSFRVAHWPPTSASTNTFIESNDTIIVTCSAAGQAYAVIDAVPLGPSDTIEPLVIVDGNGVTSTPQQLTISGSAQTDQGGGRWLLIMNSSTALLTKIQAALLYATTQGLASANALILQETMDREDAIDALQEFTAALMNTQVLNSAAISDLYGKHTTNNPIILNALQRDGIEAMEGDLNMGGHAITNAGEVQIGDVVISGGSISFNGNPKLDLDAGVFDGSASLFDNEPASFYRDASNLTNIPPSWASSTGTNGLTNTSVSVGSPAAGAGALRFWTSAVGWVKIWVTDDDVVYIQEESGGTTYSFLTSNSGALTLENGNTNYWRRTTAQPTNSAFAGTDGQRAIVARDSTSVYERIYHAASTSWYQTILYKFP